MSEITNNNNFLNDLYSLMDSIEERKKITRKNVILQIKILILKYRDINRKLNYDLLTKDKSGKIINLKSN